MERGDRGRGDVVIEPRQYHVCRGKVPGFHTMGGADERVKLGAVEGGGGRGDGIGGCGSERIEVDIEGGVKEGVVGVVGKGGKVVPFGKEPGGTVPVVGGGEVVVMLVVGVAAAAAAASPGKEGEVAGSGRSGGGCGAGAEVGVEDGGGLVEETGRKGVVVSVDVGRGVKEGFGNQSEVAMGCGLLLLLWGVGEWLRVLHS